ATDHSPSPPAMKKVEPGDFRGAWGGIASLQLALPAMWTEARKRGFTFENLAEWMCAAPARLAGLADRKGRIASGFQITRSASYPDASFTVDGSRLHHRHSLTPYEGRTLFGVVRR